MSEVWSKEKIWEWYNNRPWIRGCNYMSADCANRIDQWQSEGFEERLATTDKELALAKETGFNSIRIILEFLVWDEEHDSFMERFEKYIQVCAKNGISCMVVLANDCMRPKHLENNSLGKQHVDWGYHGGRRLSQHGKLDGIGFHVLDDPDTAERYWEMIREIVEKYKNDNRIIIWDVYNEPGNAKRGELTLPNLKKAFKIVREINPIQPLTCSAWRIGMYGLNNLPEVERFALDNSDIISYHNYDDYMTNIKIIRELEKYERPIINTEWLARCTHNTVQEMFPLFYIKKIGCYNWGLVAGKYQTYEPWNCIWEQYEDNKNIDFDFTKWFHDLYRANHRPYDPKEIDLIKSVCELADIDYKEKDSGN